MRLGKPQIAEQLEKMAYENLVVSGQVTARVSAELKLHSVIVNRAVSGGMFQISDASSGVAGTIVGEAYCGTEMLTPSEVTYDAKLCSGMVVVTSGANWRLTLTYARP